MRYLPYEEFCIDSPLTATEAEQRLVSATESDDDFYYKKTFFRKPGHYFRGYIKNGSFEIASIPGIRRSLPPQLKGSILPSPDGGSRIHVRLSLHPFVFVVLSMLVVVALVFSYFFIRHAFKNGSVAELFIPVGILIMTYIFTMIGFKSESVSGRIKLLKVLGGKISR